jgi:uncharacterized repeat protein (TIGR03803 family)
LTGASRAVRPRCLRSESDLRSRGDSPAGKFKVVYSLPGGSSGYEPLSSLTRDSAGNLYGTTYYGGKFKGPYCTTVGCGVVFKIDPAGKESIVHAFSGPPSDGQNPSAGLLRDAAGNLYGTTRNGGTIDNGTVFKISPNGKESILHSFRAGSKYCPHGQDPYAGLIMDASGNLYGTARDGGSTSGSCRYTYIGCGVVFKLDKAGKETVLHAFGGPPRDGRSPDGSLLLDNGVLYGTTRAGGVTGGACGSSDFGCGTVFSVTASRKAICTERLKPAARQAWARYSSPRRPARMHCCTASRGPMDLIPMRA